MLFLAVVALIVNPSEAIKRGVTVDFILNAVLVIFMSVYIISSSTSAKRLKELEEDNSREDRVKHWKRENPDLGFLYETLLAEIRKGQRISETRALWLSVLVSILAFLMGLYTPYFIATLAK